MAKTAADFRKSIGSALKRTTPSKSILYGVEGVGKTSLIASSPKPFGIMCAGETGLRTLIANDQIKPINHFQEPFQDWDELRDFIKAVTADKTLLCGSDSVFIDTAGTAWDLLVDHIVKKQFEGSRKKFVDYGNGMKTAVPYWREFLSDLDRLNEEQVQIWLLAHSTREMFKNPESEDYHRYEIHLPESILEITKRWADNIFFMSYFVTADEDGKGKGGTDRYLYAVRRPAFSAKNRCGLDNAGGYKLPDNSRDAWKELASQIGEARKKSKAAMKPAKEKTTEEPAETES